MKIRSKAMKVIMCIIMLFTMLSSIYIVKADIAMSLKDRIVKTITEIAESQEIREIDLGEDSDELIESATPVVDNGTYNVQIELNIVSEEGDAVVEGNKLKITDVTENSETDTSITANEQIGKNEEETQKNKLKINIMNITNGNPIEPDADGNFHTNGQGVIVDLSNMEKNRNYKIMIQDIEPAEGYNKTINSLILDVLINDEENIVAKVSEVIDESGEKMDLLSQMYAILHGKDSEGTLEIKHDKQDPEISLQYILKNDGTITEDETWNDYSNSVEIEENSTIYAKAMKNGVDSGVTFKIINNIDKQEPELSDLNQDNPEQEREITITATITDNASGLVKYGLSMSDTVEPSTYTKVDDSLTDDDIENHRNSNPKRSASLSIDGITENGDYYVWIWDTAGNCAKKQININSVHEEPVAKITEVSDGHPELVGEEYTSLRKAIDACPSGQDTYATIVIIGEIINENNQITDKHITLNLNGNNINNKNLNEPTLTVNENSSLKIINVDENNDKITQNKGSISSENTTAILVKSGATLDLRNRR